jgi:hypothetical protein
MCAAEIYSGGVGFLQPRINRKYHRVQVWSILPQSPKCGVT